jgi:hypothetical protein
MTRYLRCHAGLYEIVITVILVNSRQVIKKTIFFDLHDLNSSRAWTEQTKRNGRCVSPIPMNSIKMTSKTTSALMIGKPHFLFLINASVANFFHFDSHFRVFASIEKIARVANSPTSILDFVLSRPFKKREDCLKLPGVSVQHRFLTPNRLFNSIVNEIFPRIRIPYFNVRVS